MSQAEIDLTLLKILYKSPGKTGEIVTLLKQKKISVSLDQAHIIGRRLHLHGYIYHIEMSAYSDATLLTKGIDLIEARL